MLIRSLFAYLAIFALLLAGCNDTPLPGLRDASPDTSPSDSAIDIPSDDLGRDLTSDTQPDMMTGDSGIDGGTPSVVSACSGNGWCWEKPAINANALYSAWGTSSSSLFAVGTAGTFLHFDGSDWQRERLPFEVDFFGVHGITANDMFVVGAQILMHRNGQLWFEEITPSILFTDVVAVQTTTATPKTIAYAVGAQVTSIAQGDKGLVYRFEDGGWTVVLDTNAVNAFTAVAASSPDDVWAASSSGALYHFDGANWSPAGPAGLTTNIKDVWTDGNTVIICGDSGMLYRKTGVGAWQDISTGSDHFEEVVGPDINDVYAVTSLGDILKIGTIGTTPFTSTPGGTIFAMQVFSANDMHAFGTNGQLLRFDGATWQNARPGIITTQVDMHGASATQVYGSGTDNIIVTYDGSSWVETPIPGGFTPLSIFAINATNVYAVGTSGTARFYDGFAWISVNIPSAALLAGVWAADVNNVWAVGTGAILYFDGTSWTTQLTVPGVTFFSLFGSSASDIFAVGDLGVIYHYDGTQWTQQTSPVGTALVDVWGSSPTQYVAVGDGGVAIHFDGSTWQQKPITPVPPFATAPALRGVYGTGPNNIWAGGTNGYVHHYNGSVWQSEPTVTARTIWSTWIDENGKIYMGGEGGTIISKVP